jgi:hypothetical protein
MRTRHSTGGVRKQKGRWVGLWYEGGVKKSKVLGSISEMGKGDAREAVAKIVAGVKRETKGTTFGEFVEGAYFSYYSRKWKDSTRENNVNRISVHLVAPFGERDLSAFRRDELQDVLDMKAKKLSFSVVDHLRCRIGRPHRAQSGDAAVHASGSQKTGSPGDDDSGGSGMFQRSRPAGAVDREARDTGGDAAR